MLPAAQQLYSKCKFETIQVELSGSEALQFLSHTLFGKRFLII